MLKHFVYNIDAIFNRLMQIIDMYVKSHDTALSKTKNHEKSFEEWINYTSLKSIIYLTRTKILPTGHSK